MTIWLSWGVCWQMRSSGARNDMFTHATCAGKRDRDVRVPSATDQATISLRPPRRPPASQSKLCAPPRQRGNQGSATRQASTSLGHFTHDIAKERSGSAAIPGRERGRAVKGAKVEQDGEGEEGGEEGARVGRAGRGPGARKRLESVRGWWLRMCPYWSLEGRIPMIWRERGPLALPHISATVGVDRFLRFPCATI